MTDARTRDEREEWDPRNAPIVENWRDLDGLATAALFWLQCPHPDPGTVAAAQAYATLALVAVENVR